MTKPSNYGPYNQEEEEEEEVTTLAPTQLAHLTHCLPQSNNYQTLRLPEETVVLSQ